MDGSHSMEKYFLIIKLSIFYLFSHYHNRSPESVKEEKVFLVSRIRSDGTCGHFDVDRYGNLHRHLSRLTYKYLEKYSIFVIIT